MDLRATASIIRNRKGAVLSRQTILKADLFHSIAKGDHLQGAKNFRGVKNIYGVAQPTKTGWLTILTLLKENILWVNTREEPLVYINGCPYLLRNEYEPQRKLKFAGITTERLEQLEYRLKLDILKECKLNNLLLVHDEVNTELIPCWMAVEQVETPRELVEHFIDQGFDIQYLRLPISPEQGFVEVYVERLIEAFMKKDVDDPIVINCGMGASRTTFCMVIALMIRKSKSEDVLQPKFGQKSLESLNDLLKETDFQHKSIIKLMKVLEEGLQASAIQFAITRSSLLEHLINAVNGNYQLVLDLIRILDKGPHIKRIVDQLVDECDQIVNIRDRILFYRIKYVNSKSEIDLFKGKAQLERYYTLLVTLSYIISHNNEPFSQWLKNRPEIYNIFPKNTSTDLFKPIHNTSALSTPKNDDADLYCVRNRTGTVLGPNTILKIDVWDQQHTVVTNFRKIAHYPLYGCAQPSIKGLKFILEAIQQDYPSPQVSWINVREEPVLYVNGLPYVLRDQSIALRNISFMGINSSRLELMEERLKQDVLLEIQQYNHQLLLHSEINNEIISQWEDVLASNVLTLNSVFTSINYSRIPITAEGIPEPSDFEQLVQVLINCTGPVVVNCQMGIGRSTMVLSIAILVYNWQHNVISTSPSPVINYQSVHQLLRVIKDGLEVKNAVDKAIDSASALMNIRDSIEKYRIEADSTTEDIKRQDLVTKSILNLQRYFMLIVFNAYLNQNKPDAYLIPFHLWLEQHEEIKQMMHDLQQASFKDVVPVNVLAPGDGLALSNEVLQVVSRRNGQVMGQNTILKDDAFPGCQKPSLIERVQGAPNYRKVEFSKVTEYSGSCYGIAMPTYEGIKNCLSKINSLCFWTSLREEPVVYILNKPYVLREFHEPLKNLESTGIAKERVELMELAMKQDCLLELQTYGNRLLLHEEVLTEHGFSINAVWQTIQKEDILTPKEMFDKIIAEGYKVDYERIPITDEQAPIPEVFDLLTQRINSATSEDLLFNCQMGRGTLYLYR